jgi:hypothetical protein
MKRQRPRVLFQNNCRSHWFRWLRTNSAVIAHAIKVLVLAGARSYGEYTDL